MSHSQDPEVAALKHFLDAQRSSVLAIVAGLDEASLRTEVLPSGWSPIGLIEHLGDAEWHWFQQVALATDDDPPWAAGDRSSEEVFAYYKEQCRRANLVLDSMSLDAPPAGRHGEPELEDKVTDLRWIVLHLIEETARHAGHLDVVRELLDGQTGLGPR